MKIEALIWIKDFLLNVIKQLLELLIRIILFLLPLGIYLTLLQFRQKVSSTSNLSVFTNKNSVWQHIFPGFILVAIDPNFFKNSISFRYTKFQNFIKDNKYTLCFLLGLAIVIFMILFGSR